MSFRMFRLFSPSHLRLHETFIPPPNAEIEYRSHETLARSEHIFTSSASPLIVASKYPSFAISEDLGPFEVESVEGRGHMGHFGIWG